MDRITARHECEKEDHCGLERPAPASPRARPPCHRRRPRRGASGRAGRLLANLDHVHRKRGKALDSIIGRAKPRPVLSARATSARPRPSTCWTSSRGNRDRIDERHAVSKQRPERSRKRAVSTLPARSPISGSRSIRRSTKVGRRAISAAGYQENDRNDRHHAGAHTSHHVARAEYGSVTQGSALPLCSKMAQTAARPPRGG